MDGFSGTPGGVSGQFPGASFNGPGMFAGGSLGGGNINSGTITSSNPFSITQIWNDLPTTFKAFLLDITDTTSAAASLLADFQVGGNSKFSVSKNGRITVAVGNYPYTSTGGGYWAGAFKLLESSGNSTTIWQYTNAANPLISLVGGNTVFGSAVNLNWSSTGDPNQTADIGLGRKAAKILEINSGIAATYAGTALSTGVQTVAQLPAAATAGAGARSMVSDANSVVFNAAAVGGGANIMPVFCNGAGWFIG